jgi:hypothetical protein
MVTPPLFEGGDEFQDARRNAATRWRVREAIDQCEPIA